MTRAAIESVIKMLALGWSYHWIHNAARPAIILSTTLQSTGMHCTMVTTFHRPAQHHNIICATSHCTLPSPHAHWWYHWIGNGRRCAANDLDQNCRISHKNAPSRQIIMHTGENHFRDIENEHKLFAESINLNLIMEPPDILTMPRYLWFSRESHLFQDSLGVQTRCFSVF